MIVSATANAQDFGRMVCKPFSVICLWLVLILALVVFAVCAGENVLTPRAGVLMNANTTLHCPTLAGTQLQPYWLFFVNWVLLWLLNKAFTSAASQIKNCCANWLCFKKDGVRRSDRHYRQLQDSELGIQLQTQDDAQSSSTSDIDTLFSVSAAFAV